MLGAEPWRCALRPTIFLAWLAAAALFAAGALLGSPLFALFDLPSLLFVGLGGIALSVVAAPLAAHVRALRLGLGRGAIAPAEGDAARATLRGQALAVLGAGVVGDIIGLVQMLQHLSDPSAIGPALAVSMLTVLYALVWCGMVVWPLDASIARRQVGPAEGAAPRGVAGASSAGIAGLATFAYLSTKGGAVFGLLAAMA